MADFDKAVETTLVHEGGLCDIPGDPGGITNFGVSLRFLTTEGVNPSGPGPATADTVRHLTRDQAIEIYRQHFWDSSAAPNINDDGVAEKFFDMAVNMGAKRAGQITQKSVNVLGGSLAVDGVLGATSVQAINELDGDLLVSAMCTEQAKFYKDLVNSKPKMAKFLKGWLVRAACSRATPCKTCRAKKSD